LTDNHAPTTIKELIDNVAKTKALIEKGKLELKEESKR
jgi:hypothetical protein